jgi:hypothetical protein
VQATIGTINTWDLSPGSRCSDVTVQVQGNVTTGDISSRGSVTGVAGGSINISSIQGAVDTTAGTLDSLGSGGGDITLQAQGNVITGDISSRGLITSVGGSINISSIQGAVDTTAGALDSFGPEGGDITVQAQGNVTTGDISSRGLIINAGDSVGGSINISSIQGAVDITAGALDSSSADADGVGGPIAVEAAGGIAAGGISSTGAAGSGDILLVGEEIDLRGSPGSVQATNASVSLQPFTPAQQDILVGGARDTDTEALDLTVTDLAALADGFASITIGRNDGSGTISIVPAGISLNDPLILQSPAAGGIIDADGPIQTTGSVGATAPTIGLQDVTSNDFQAYTGSVTFNSTYATGGGSFTVQGDSTLASGTTVVTDGGDVNFLGGLEGPGALTIAAGSGDILFQGDVGAQIPLGFFSVASAQNVSLGGQFVAGPSEFVYDGSLTSPDPSLQVESLVIDPDATSATLFGSVGGASGREAALAVEGPSGDPDFTINGFLMGSSEPEEVAESDGLTAAEPNTDTAEEVAVAKQDVFVAEEPSPEPEEPSPPEPEEKSPLAAFEVAEPVQFPPKFNMSNFTMNATIKAGWPLIVDYQLERPGEVRVSIAVEGVEHFTFELDGTTTDRKQRIVNVPKRFGVRVEPASITVRASEQGGTKAVPLHLYGLGAGPKAVGSVAIDSILFGPTHIRTFFSDTAAYRFHSRSDFDTVKVDFCKVTDTIFEEDTDESVHTQDIEQGVGAYKWIGVKEPRNWNGRNRRNKVSPGLHKLRVRAWDKPGQWCRTRQRRGATAIDSAAHFESHSLRSV